MSGAEEVAAKPNEELDPVLARFIDECVVELIVRSLRNQQDESEVE